MNTNLYTNLCIKIKRDNTRDNCGNTCENNGTICDKSCQLILNDKLSLQLLCEIQYTSWCPNQCPQYYYLKNKSFKVECNLKKKTQNQKNALEQLAQLLDYLSLKLSYNKKSMNVY